MFRLYRFCLALFLFGELGFFVCFLCFVFEEWSHYVALAILELVM